MFFRFHRGSLQDSLGTTVSVESFEDLVRVIQDNDMYYIDGIRIISERIPDARLPIEWNGVEYRVVGNYFGQEVIVGFSSGVFEEVLVDKQINRFNLFEIGE